MKKGMVLIAALCLLLAACGDQTGDAGASVPETPSEAGQASDRPEDGEEVTSEPSPEAEETSEEEPAAETDLAGDGSYPAVDGMINITVGDGFDEGTVYPLGGEEREELWKLMRIDQWEEALDLPPMGFAASFYVEEEEQVWFFNQFDGQTLIVPSVGDQSGEKICYLAPADVITGILAYTETLTPQ